MNVFDFLNKLQDPVEREQLAAQMSALYAPPENAAITGTQPQGDLPPAQPAGTQSVVDQRMQGQGTPPPTIPAQVPQAQGPFTSPPGSMPRNAQGAPGTQSGPAVESPEVEKAKKEEALAKLLSSSTGMMPMMEAPAIVPPPGGNGPSLGSASPAQTFQMASPTPGNQSMVALAQLLGG